MPNSTSAGAGAWSEESFLVVVVMVASSKPNFDKVHDHLMCSTLMIAPRKS